MTPAERSAAIYKANEEFNKTLESLGVDTLIVAIAIDETPVTGYGVSGVKGDSRILLEMTGTVVKTLPSTEFWMLLHAMANGEAFAAHRGEEVQPASPTDPMKVN